MNEYLMKFCKVAILFNQKSLDMMSDEVKDAFQQVFHKPPVKTDGGLWLYYSNYLLWEETQKPLQTILNFIWGLDGDEGETVEFCKTGLGKHVLKTEQWSNSPESRSLRINTCIEVDGIDAPSIWPLYSM